MGVKQSKFSFLPWLRQGISAKISQPETFGEISDPVQTRATVPFTLAIDAVPNGGSAYSESVAEIVQNIEIFGPGEVIGINPEAIVNTDPRPNITDYAPNTLPYIEFYEEDFPWRYTPAHETDSKLRPWLILLVLEMSEFKKVRLPDAPLPSITHGDDKEIPFPDESQTWAWAHVHINKTLDKTPELNSFGKVLFDVVENDDPNLASSRIISPRYLKENTKYQAFLIPAFEQGRLAGLGAEHDRIIAEDVRKSSWSGHAIDEFTNQWPYYYEWSFHTAERLDFESLVRSIDPVVLDDNVGRRPMDCNDAGYLISYEGSENLPGIDDQGILELEGALQSPVATIPGNKPRLLGVDDQVKKDFLSQLKDFLNLNTDLKNDHLTDNFYESAINDIFPDDIPDGTSSEDYEDDPIVLPPLYGQWHASKERIEYDIEAPSPTNEVLDKDIEWFDMANLDPRHRTAAGLGTQVVQKNQENYMDRAWEQVGDVLNAIRKLRRGELSLEASRKLYLKHLWRLNGIQFTSITSAIHAKLIPEFASETIAVQVSKNITSPVFGHQIFSKVARPNGPVFRRLGISATNNQVTNTIVNDFSGLASEPNVAQYGGTAFDRVAVGDAIGGLISETGGLMMEGGIFSGNNWQGLDLDKVTNIINIGGFNIGPVISPRSMEEEENPLSNYFKDNRNWNPNATSADNGAYSDPVVEDPEVPNSEVFDFYKSQITPCIDPEKVITSKVWSGISITQKAPEIELQSIPRSTQIGTRGIEVVEASKPEEIRGVLAYPEFPDPMYKALKDLSETYFLPGIDRIPENSFSILATNQRFIEAFMLGINHEMSRELLWREYPTDQKGSYFRKFWENISSEPNANPFDINEITSWKKFFPTNQLKALGCNHPDGNKAVNRLVFTIRGELLKKFPNTVIYLQKGYIVHKKEDGVAQYFRRTIDPREFPVENGFTITPVPNSDPDKARKTYLHPVFQAKADPDITFLGFNITPDEALGDLSVNDPGYFIVIKERPGEPRFGFDIQNDEAKHPSMANEDDPDDRFTWNDGNWKFVGLDEAKNYIKINQGAYAAGDGVVAQISNAEDEKLVWGKNAAHMAGILYQLPFMIAIHADVMISEELEEQHQEISNC